MLIGAEWTAAYLHGLTLIRTRRSFALPFEPIRYALFLLRSDPLRYFFSLSAFSNFSTLASSSRFSITRRS